MNSWESYALDYRFSKNGKSTSSPMSEYPSEDSDDTSDPVIYPGLYCPSGLDMMTVLLRIYARPNAQINLGPIDCSVALIVCDLAQRDNPIVYASDPFLQMTGYQMKEIQGKNCRFLQEPGGNVMPMSNRNHVDNSTIRGMRDAIKANKEHQTTITNFTKDGKSFVNLLTLIPITWDSQDFRYSVGFQCDKASLARAA